MKAPVVKIAAAKIATMKASAMKNASGTSVVGLGSSPADRSGEGDSNDGCCHRQFPGHGYGEYGQFVIGRPFCNGVRRRKRRSF
jgi:hypothetical protein